jgi:hypothetical protein
MALLTDITYDFGTKVASSVKGIFSQEPAVQHMILKHHRALIHISTVV